LDLHFPTVVYKKLLGQTPTFEDLEDFDPSLSKGLKQLLDFDGDVEGTFLRSFQVESENYGEKIKFDLKPNGGEIPVTKENRQEYVDLLVKWILVDSISKQFDSFKKGFDSVCSGEPLELFRYEELELLVLGSSVLDFDELEKVTRYVEGYSAKDEYMQYLSFPFKLFLVTFGILSRTFHWRKRRNFFNLPLEVIVLQSRDSEAWNSLL
jgi:ubiquitin-protein ligase E3 A